MLRTINFTGAAAFSAIANIAMQVKGEKVHDEKQFNALNELRKQEDAEGVQPEVRRAGGMRGGIKVRFYTVLMRFCAVFLQFSC